MTLTEVTIGNMALSRLGITRALQGDADGTLANCTDTTTGKDMLDLWYPRKRDALLESFPWSFARKYASLGAVLDDGTGEVWEDLWDYAYTYPADCLKIRRFVVDVGTGLYATGDEAWYRYRPRPAPFEVKMHGAVKAIFTDVPVDCADIEYTAAVTDASTFTEEFASLLAWVVAAELSEGLAVDTRRADRALFMAQQAMYAAAASVTNEQEPRPEGDGDFIASRSG